MKAKRSVRINTISIASIAIAVVVAALLIVAIFRTDRGFAQIQKSTLEYMVCQNAASDLESASEYLTEQVQLFVISGDPRNMNLYFEEAEVTRRRENAITALEQYYAGTETMRQLNNALTQSVELMDTEYHAMRLAAEAFGMDLSALNENIRNFPLPAEELSMSKTDQRELALSLVSDRKYQETRNAIADGVNGCMTDIINAVTDLEVRAASVFRNSYLKLKISVALLVLLVIGMSILIRQIIVKPLLKYDDNVKSGEALPLEGAYELRQLAEIYNDVYEEHQENLKLLRHEADHDALTRVFNRGAFNRLLDLYENGSAGFALIIIDVDNFKSFNDVYGHTTGDHVLQRVAAVVKNGFRSMDYVCRIGGDEFAVIMVEVGEQHKNVISEKLRAIDMKLSNPSGKTPPITLSIGIALSDRGNPGDSIYKDADSALYKVKENGRNGFRFYEGGDAK